MQHKKIATFTQFNPPKIISNILQSVNVNFHLPSIYVLNPVAVVYDIVDQVSKRGDTFTSTAYCTLKGHLLSGEERVSVILRDYHACHDGHANVDVEILSCSRPAPTLLGKLVWPFISKKQDEFFRRELEALEKVAIDFAIIDEKEVTF